MADRITVALYPHRPEALDRAARLMQGHDAVILEEPETPGFADMLSGRLEVDEYLLGVDFEYPVLARRTCDLARRLFGQGKAVLQVDPFMDRLMAVHELLGSGAGPGDVLADPDLAPVYRAERAWTRTLVDFYKKSIGPSFSEAVAAVIEFAGADAARGRLRDAMRASSLARLARGMGAAFVEAGYIHIYLLRELKRLLGPKIKLACALPLGPVFRALCGRAQALGPGDVLTLLLTFRPGHRGQRLGLLAARSLIHSKIALKEEIPAARGEFPHARDQVYANSVTRRLSMADCQGLHRDLRGLGTRESRNKVEGFLAGRG